MRLLDEAGQEVALRGQPRPETTAWPRSPSSPGTSRPWATGSTRWSLQPRPAAAAADRSEGDGVLENEALRVVIDPQSGNLKSIFDKRLSREFVAPGEEANKLWVYEDRPEDWDAWNIGYTGRGWELNKADKVELVSSGPVKTVYRVDKSFLGFSKEREYPTEDFPSSFFKQYITLYNGLDRIDIRTEADWWEDHLSLKACFPVAVKADKAFYEIPFAAIGRTTRFDTLWEKARYEVPALRWADLVRREGRHRPAQRLQVRPRHPRQRHEAVAAALAHLARPHGRPRPPRVHLLHLSPRRLLEREPGRAPRPGAQPAAAGARPGSTGSRGTGPCPRSTASSASTAPA